MDKIESEEKIRSLVQNYPNMAVKAYMESLITFL
jgi:hypothetical protein